MKLNTTCNYAAKCLDLGYDCDDLDMEEVYESTLTSILDMEEDMEGQANFEN
jgi:hypothetical protein